MDFISNSRKHGLQKPFHPFQITSWIVSFYNAFVYCIIILSEYDKPYRIIFSIIFSILCVCYLMLGYIVSKSDPTDPSVDIYRYCKDPR